MRYVTQRMHVGDILFHLPSGTIFVVMEIGAGEHASSHARPIVTKQLNNMLTDADGTFRAQSSSHLALAGDTLLLNDSIDLPAQVYYGDFDAKGNITKVERGDGFAGDIAKFLSVGDVLFPFSWNDAYLSWPIANSFEETIATVTVGSPASLTLAGAGAVTAGPFPIYPLPIIRGQQSLQARIRRAKRMGGRPPDAHDEAARADGCGPLRLALLLKSHLP